MRSVAYCGYNLPLQSDIKVKEMSKHLKKLYPERKKNLLQVLDIDEEWKLNCISEGQRKRVQLYLNLIKPFDICLLDEITVNLDILVKYKLFNYLKKECINNNSCVIYVTHIFDGLDDWYDSLIYVSKDGLVDEVEKIAIDRVTQLFGCNFANVQPHSGAQANAAVMLALLNPGDKILGFDLAHGGHLTHGSSVNFSGKIYKSFFYGVRKDDGLIDYSSLEKTAKKENITKLIKIDKFPLLNSFSFFTYFEKSPKLNITIEK